MADLRKQTRDMLLDNMDCDCKPLPTPGGGYSLSVFTDMMFQVAQNNGYVGTKNEFEEDFVGALANDAKTCNVMDLVQNTGDVLIFDCGNSTEG